MPQIINQSYQEPQPVNASFSVTNTKGGNNMIVKLKIAFRPFDLRDYRWTLYMTEIEQHGEIFDFDNQTLNWNKCTAINYIPFKLMRASNPGIYTSVSDPDAGFVEIDNWSLGLDKITHTMPFGQGVGGNALNIIETNLKDRVRGRFGQVSSNWYTENSLGKMFNFKYALNGNLFFSAIVPPNSNNFDNALEQLCNGTIDGSQAMMWSSVSSGRNSTNEVTITASVDISNDGDRRTYAVVYGNPYTGSIYTEYIQNVTSSTQTTTTYTYVPGSIETDKDTDKLFKLVINQEGNASAILNISKRADAGNFGSAKARFSFKIRKNTIS